MSSVATIVVPCYNEAARLPVERFAEFRASHPEVSFILVDDGSTDDTLAVLSGLAERDSGGVTVLEQKPNQGKAAAVWRGMQVALEGKAPFAGYWDADLATPLDEIPRFVTTLEDHPELTVAMGARVQLLGKDIRRSALRHYVGRVFATAASRTLGLAVYDTQAGCKLFRVNDETRHLFEAPFLTRWIFDVELIARLIHHRRHQQLPAASTAIIELPLDTWHDIPGSKVRLWDFPRALVELSRIRRTYRPRAP